VKNASHLKGKIPKLLRGQRLLFKGGRKSRRTKFQILKKKTKEGNLEERASRKTIWGKSRAKVKKEGGKRRRVGATLISA